MGKLCLRIRQEQRQQLQAIATASGTDLSGAARHLLQQAMDLIAA